ncbi:MAG: 4-(cytidine 5'-diphospho)-2-C-methyl-D-erythritol kinase [Actinobacteria bacterium]|nr:4-(cytidine 5'-diphospho)-2-C-methyl-D-erythritol kinase [Actinomycetota bacterium]
MIRIMAYAKVNFGLRVGSRRADGFHPIFGRFQSISVADELAVAFSETDEIVAKHGGPVPAGRHNLAWLAIEAVRREAGSRRPVTVTLTKNIPVAAGLGGGSADCAAALVAAQRLFGISDESVADLSRELGSDVPFCLAGGYAQVSGRGERVEQLSPVGGFALALVVPPVELSTSDVFRQWDLMKGPQGSEVDTASLPTALRGEDFRNDLTAPALALRPEVGEWQAELRTRWGRDVMMSGSGPSLFAFALDAGEATDMVNDVPVGARFAGVAEPVATGWMMPEIS